MTTNNNNVCAICTDTVTPGSRRILTDCNHVFHRKCLTTWATKNSRVQGNRNPHGVLNRNPTCPICRRYIKPTLLKYIMKLSDRLAFFMEAFENVIIRIHESGNFNNLYLPPTIKKNNNRNKFSVPLQFEYVTSLIFHIMFYNVRKDDPLVKEFKTTFIKLLKAHSKFTTNFKHSFGSVNIRTGNLRNTQITALSESFDGYIPISFIGDLIVFIEHDTGILKTIELFSRRNSSTNRLVNNLSRVNGFNQDERFVNNVENALYDVNNDA